MRKQSIIIVKGQPNSGKSSSIFHFKSLLGQTPQKMLFEHEGITLRVIVMSIHESRNWKDRLIKIIDCDQEVIIIAAWADDCVLMSQWGLLDTLENEMERQAPNQFDFHIVHTMQHTKPSQFLPDNERCANEIKVIIETVARSKRENEEEISAGVYAVL